MEFTVYKTSNSDRQWKKVLSSLEDLISFVNNAECRIIVHRPDKDINGWMLEIYDDYRE